MQSFIFRSNRHSGIIIDAECWGRTQVNVFTVYYTHFEITGGPCNLIGSNWCDLFTNCTIFLLYEEATLKTKQPIRLQGLFHVTDQIAGR